VTAQQEARLSPLEMAVNLAAAVQAYAEALNHPDPDRRLQAQIAQAGERAHSGAQLAANLALVSIAQDVHALRRVMLGQADPDTWTKAEDWTASDGTVAQDPEASVGNLDDPDSPISRWARNEGPLAQEGAVDDARRTREHMRSWGQGEQDHPGEGTDPDEHL
jgi:hypothetical protein